MGAKISLLINPLIAGGIIALLIFSIRENKKGNTKTSSWLTIASMIALAVMIVIDLLITFLLA